MLTSILFRWYCSLSSKLLKKRGSLLLPEVYDRYKLLLHKNDLNIVIDSDKDMSKLLQTSGKSKEPLFFKSFDDKLQYHLKRIDVNILACNFMFFNKQSCKYEEVWANFSSAASDLEKKLKEL
jgi:hypothetical protein